MDFETVKNLWQPHGHNAKAAVEWWNGNAEKYSAMELPSPENSLAMRIIEKEGMVKAGSTVLDVGCGGGRFSFAFAAMGAKAVATDFSRKMIEEALKRQEQMGTNVSFRVDDWRTLDLKGKRWDKSFDLVLAHMTPAVTSADTFLKLSDASRNWVLMLKPTRRTNSVLDELIKIIGADEDTKSLDETIAFAFDILWMMGCSPKLEYEKQIWKNDVPLEQAIREYTLRLSSMHDLSDEDKDRISTYLRDIAQDGIVHETTNTTIVAMYWQVI
ncbi:MAG: class I SAM-dependent methyltransferase [Clostridiales bacterium]|nr:class I SAM-dependent methyltransferase [Clostridiales bacterium]